jgi:hypothetical protein
MQLQLENEYLYPWVEPEDPDADPCLNRTGPLITGVVAFEWLHTLTVGFKDADSFHAAQHLTGWKRWSVYVLEAVTSQDDGYDHPAIILPALNRAYCGFIVLSDFVGKSYPISSRD